MNVRLIVVFLTFFIVARSPSALAHDPEVKASFALGRSSSVEVISTDSRSALAQEVSQILRRTQEEFQILLDQEISVKASVHLLDEEVFFRVTKAPRWTNALFVGGKILIPVSEKTDYQNLERSARHEFVHSITHSLTGGRLPGWFDEGFAQWAEGETLPILETILQRWMRTEEIVPFSQLQGGFTKLETKTVAPAYAQSLFAVNSLLKTYGFNSFGTYFSLLKNGYTRADAFKGAFGISEANFEKRFGAAMKLWARTSEKPSFVAF